MRNSISDILNNRTHRPWDLPSHAWAYYQEWNDVVFLHWHVDADKLRPFLPANLELDLHDGKAWVSIVAFTMERIRPRYLPSFPPVSHFHEINIRTYVRHGDKTGVYFLSIEGAKWWSCQIAKSLSGLPYRYADMEREKGLFLSHNKDAKNNLSIRYKTGAKMLEKTTLDNWLTERYALFLDKDSDIQTFDIHHLEWPLMKLELTHFRSDYPVLNGLINRAPTLIHYSTGVQVLAWDKT